MIKFLKQSFDKDVRLEFRRSVSLSTELVSPMLHTHFEINKCSDRKRSLPPDWEL